MKDKKIIISLAVIIIAVIIFSLAMFFFNRKKENQGDVQKANQEKIQTELRKKIATEDIELIITGRIVYFDEKIVRFIELDGKELELKIPEKQAVPFIKKNSDNTEDVLAGYEFKSIGKNQEISIAYMTFSKKLRKVIVE
ncbi:MAG: hypothetical protein COX29_03500 [Candidatus Moranbacteria bacterium CG23_combo_of_CG06-09_8_20_14_all_35_22]|nr:MAG: hypothetical protein COX29_03500 [Candidatus Moranbacteria bacterium CG23_combo_of_CG06-09_8_20_14_all_35_22]